MVAPIGEKWLGKKNQLHSYFSVYSYDRGKGGKVSTVGESIPPFVDFPSKNSWDELDRGKNIYRLVVLMHWGYVTPYRVLSHSFYGILLFPCKEARPL